MVRYKVTWIATCKAQLIPSGWGLLRVRTRRNTFLLYFSTISACVVYYTKLSTGHGKYFRVCFCQEVSGSIGGYFLNFKLGVIKLQNISKHMLLVRYYPFWRGYCHWIGHTENIFYVGRYYMKLQAGRTFPGKIVWGVRILKMPTLIYSG